MRSNKLGVSLRARRAGFVSRAIALVTSVALVGGPSARADLVAGWDFQTTTTGGTALAASPATPKVIVANFGSGTLYFDGSNGSSDWYEPATGSTNTELNAFGGTVINAGSGFSNVTSGAAALALVGGASNAANGKLGVFKFSMTGWQDLAVSYASQRTSTGFTSLKWEASSDGSSWTTIGTLASSTSFVATGTLSLPTISLLNNAATAYLRISGTGASAASGNNRLDNIQFNATAYVPPSGTSTWVGTGSGGTWSNGGTGNFGSPYSNSLTTAVLFTGVGETVTLSGGVQAGSVSFQPASGNYTLTGSTLELGGGVNATVASGVTATVNSAIAGSGGLTKGGAGLLVLGGVNTFTGNVSVSQGTVQIASDAALGNTSNDVSMTGTLKTTANVSLDGGRDFTGSGNFAIAPGTTLTINGSSALVGTTLTDAGTLSLQGAGRSVGALTFNTAARIEAAGAVTVGSGITASSVTSGSAVINAGVTFNSNGDKTVDVGSGGTLAINGDVAGTTGRIAKTGSGTLVINGANTTGGLRIGASSATPTAGGTVVLANSQASGTNQMQLNYGTLSTTVPGGVTVPAGVSVGGRADGLAVIGGSQPITFTGSSSFYRSFGTSGEIRLNVSNTTTFSGTLGPTTGSGSSTGVTIGGTGRLILAATGINASGTNFTDRLTVNSGATVQIADQNALAYAPLDTSGGGTVTFSVPAANFAAVQGTGTLALKDISNAPIVLTLSQTTSGTYAGGFSGPGSVVKNGDSVLSLTGASTHTGTTSVQQGTLQIANGSALGSSTLAIANGATASVANYTMVGAGGLAIGSDGLLDVTSGGMTAANTSAAAAVARIIEGRGDGSWNGTKGITSSAAATAISQSIPRTMGWLDNGDGSVTFAFAAAGDTNLDWSVDILDAANFLAGGKFDSGSPATWNEGDFGYDGFVDILDAADFLSTGLFDAGVYNPPATQVGAVAAVPEPAVGSLGLVAAGASLLLLRRRRPRV